MKALSIVAIILLCVDALQAEVSWYWRVLSAQTSQVFSITTDGYLAWSNSLPGEMEQVQRAESITSNAWADYVLVLGTGVVSSLKAFDVAPPFDMVLIPEGQFAMGAATNAGFEAGSGTLPQHTVFISGFYMDRHEVTSNLWRDVFMWATNMGYRFDNIGSGKGGDHPVHGINWYDCVAWCNARSQREGLTPCYTNADGSIYRDSTVQLDFTADCNWSANGYRLPTEAEWEKAARGGVANHRFPWRNDDLVSHVRANYNSYWEEGLPYYPYDVSPTEGSHPSFQTGDFPYTSPVGSFPANSYGLYDMAGNVWELCWDSYDEDYYQYSPVADPRGPAGLNFSVVVRGGSWAEMAAWMDVSSRSYECTRFFDDETVGFRCVRRL